MRRRHAKHRRPGRHLPRWTVATVALGFLATVVLAWQASYSAFASTTSNSGNSWGAGTVALTDNSPGVAVFNNVSGLIPGSFGNNCILVTYTGNLASTVEFYSENYAGTLGPYLNLTITTGSGTSCAAFGAVTTIFSGTLQALRTSSTTFATGLPAAIPWSPSANGAAKPYKFSYTLADDNAAQSATATVDFVWEARSP